MRREEVTFPTSVAVMVNTAIIAVDALHEIAVEGGRLDVAEHISAALISLHDARRVAGDGRTCPT